LDGGDAAVLEAPEASFARELARFKLAPRRFEAKPAREGRASDEGRRTAQTHAEQSLEAELADLRAALKKAKVKEATQILAAHEIERRKLIDYVEAGAEATNKFPQIECVPGLPAEFADYLKGSLAWQNRALEDKAPAREAWEQLLARPPEQRHFKSTWAAYMLGRSWQEDDPEKAIPWFEKVRELAKEGFADSLGLAAASLGWEARAYLDQKKYEEAIERYLEQMATGDPSATNSLRFTAARALKDPGEALIALAKNHRTQRVITAYALAQPLWESTASDSDEASAPRTTRETCIRNWLEAVEKAEVTDVESAEELALAAYRANQMALAQRWIKRAPNSLIGQWLQAKLFLRAGKLDRAAAIMARVSHYLPVEPRGTNEVAPVALQDVLYMNESPYWIRRPIGRQVLGELGTLRLARREYVQALNALLNAGFWMDAAYVAERVLTADELKAYVDGHWPPVSADQIEEENAKFGEDEISPVRLREQIRYLLARRLVRLNRSGEAREYYPPAWLSLFDAYQQALRTGWDKSQASDERARGFFSAAFIIRTNGMELIGTEVEPDWHVFQGDFVGSLTASARATNEGAKVLVASREELRRSASHDADPEVRFHYRYVAAALGWEAAQLLPNNNDETARILCTAGSWLKYRDPETADFFYKALVRRNRKTALGAEADRRRWFPRLDENGDIIIANPAAGNSEPMPPENSTDGDPRSNEDTPDDAIMTEAQPGNATVEPEGSAATDDSSPSSPMAGGGHEYIVHKGDTISRIISALEEMGIQVSLEDLLRANPGLAEGKLKVGQKLLIPVPEQ
jgi:hypothetical protein